MAALRQARRAYTKELGIGANARGQMNVPPPKVADTRTGWLPAAVKDEP